MILCINFSIKMTGMNNPTARRCMGVVDERKGRERWSFGESVVDFNCRERLDYMPMMGEQSQRGEWGPT